MDKKEVQTGLDWICNLEARARDVARLIYPNFGSNFEHIGFDRSVDWVHAEVALRYDQDWVEDFPLCYLWMDNDAILADVAERKRKELEANRLREIEESERKIKQLRSAASDLAKEEARLAKLKEQV